MSYGVFRLNGRGGKDLVLVATFEELATGLSDYFLPDPSIAIFDESMRITVTELSSNPVIAQMFLNEAIQAEEIFNPTLYEPYMDVAVLADSVEVFKTPIT